LRLFVTATGRSTGFRLFVRTSAALSGGILLNQPGTARVTGRVSNLAAK